MKYIDVRVRLPLKHLGMFIDELPPYAQMVGYDKLEQEPNQLSVSVRRPSLRGSTANGKYTPGKGTAAEGILKTLGKEALIYHEIISALESKFAKRAISSAIYTLRDKGEIKKQPDGRYAPTH